MISLKDKVLLLITLLGSFLLFGQSSTNLPGNILQYYKFIEKAEENILRNNKKQASKYYKKAFVSFEKPFSSDIYNSLIVNLDIDDEQSTVSDYLRLKCLNYKSPSLENNEVLQKFYIRNKKKIENYSCSNKINFNLKRKLDSLFLIDQNIRKTLSFFKDREKTIYKSDSVNAKELYNLLEKHGFIGEYEVGAQNGSDYIFLNYLIIILHQQQLSERKAVDFEPILNKALIEGKLKNKNFIDILGGMNSQKTGYSCFALYKIENECCFVDKDIYRENRNKRAKSVIAQIEKKRAKIGLNNLDNSLANKLFRLKNPQYKLETEGIVEISSPGFNDFLKSNTVKITFEDFIKNRKW